jgi:hypothetical protein
MKMKKYISLPVIVAATLFFVGCKKNDGFITKEYLDLLDKVPAVTSCVNATGSQAIDLLNLSKFAGKFDVALYFPDEPAPQKIDIVVRKNGLNTNVKVYKAGVTTFPSSYTVTAAELATLFGTAIKLGDTYDFGADVYIANGTKYEVFPLGGIGVAPGPANAPNYCVFARFAAICAYDPAIYQGNFIVVTDEWADYAPGDVVPITQVSPTSFSFVYGAAGPVPIVVKVNTGNNVTSVTKQVYGTLGYPPGWPYGPISVESVAGSTANIVTPCDKEFSVRLTHTVAAGSFGSYTIRMKKQ